MTTKTRYSVKFGNKAPIPVEKATYHGATLTKAVDDIRARIDEAIDQLANITSVRKARNKDFTTRMIRKTKRNLYVKVGYGANNEGFSDVLEGYFDCPIRARTSLHEAKMMLSAGDFDEEINQMLALKRARASLARSGKSCLVTQPVEKITTFRVIEDTSKSVEANIDEQEDENVTTTKIIAAE
jgi:hypothetical protein